MIADLPNLHTPPAIAAPEAIDQVRKRRRDSGGSNENNTATPRPTIPAWLYVGAIVMMTGDDGEPYPCQVTYIDAGGYYYCTPTTNP